MRRNIKTIGLSRLGSVTVVISLVLLATVSCSRENETESATAPAVVEVEKVKIPVFNAQDVPSSRRSRQAITAVAPGLIRELQKKNLAYGSAVFIRIFKAEKKLEVWIENEKGFGLFRTYDIAAMSGTLGPKLLEGDRQAPEGFYYVSPARMNPNSRHHLSFNLGYPNTYDRKLGRTGSALMVHGNRVSIGCYAMTDARIEEIYALADGALRNGQKFFRVHCFPFRMTDENMAKHSRSEWLPFWKNLKRGYDIFEQTKRPPNVLVKNKVYVFEMAAISGPKTER